MKKIIIIVLGIFVVMLILFTTLWLGSLKKRVNRADSPSPTGYEQRSPSPKAGTRYNQSDSQRIFKTIQNRPTPSVADAEVKKDILASIGNRSAVLHETELFRLEYVKAPDTFEAEIKTSDFNAAKEATVKWFLDKGMSIEGVCKLPLIFYPSSHVQSSFTTQGIEFSPLANECK